MTKTEFNQMKTLEQEDKIIKDFHGKIVQIIKDMYEPEKEKETVKKVKSLFYPDDVDITHEEMCYNLEILCKAIEDYYVKIHAKFESYFDNDEVK